MDISPNAQALDLLLMDEPDETDDTKVDEKCIKLSISHNVKNYVKHELNIDQVNSTELSRGFLEQQSDSLTLSSDQVAYIEQITVGQAQNKTWNAFRIGMITASSFRKVCDAIDNNRNPPSLLKSLLGTYSSHSDDDNNPALLAWGKKNEEEGRDLYLRANRRKHCGCKITKKGLTVYACKCYIGCSSDGVFSCKCKNPSHEDRNIEIKCPYSLRNENPKIAAVQKGCEFNQNFFDNTIQKVKDYLKDYFEQQLLSALIAEVQVEEFLINKVVLLLINCDNSLLNMYNQKTFY